VTFEEGDTTALSLAQPKSKAKADAWHAAIEQGTQDVPEEIVIDA